jgi:hypothetical protein
MPGILVVRSASAEGLLQLHREMEVGSWLFGRPTVEELRLDLRAVLQRCRPDWDISTAEQRAAWAKGEKARFFPYGKTGAQVLAEQD